MWIENLKLHRCDMPVDVEFSDIKDYWSCHICSAIYGVEVGAWELLWFFDGGMEVQPATISFTLLKEGDVYGEYVRVSSFHYKGLEKTQEILDYEAGVDRRALEAQLESHTAYVSEDPFLGGVCEDCPEEDVKETKKPKRKWLLRE